MSPKVLFVLTSASKLGSSGKPTGWYAPEFAHPYYQIDKYADVVVASPAGGVAPLDEHSAKVFKDDEEVKKFLKEKESLWKNTEKISSLIGKAKEFEAIIFVGGHGPMFDLATDAESQQVIREFYESGKVVAAVCHGPAALVNVKLSDGSYLVANEPVTALSNAEEDMYKMTEFMPFMLESELVKHGAKFEKAAEPGGAKVVVAGKNGRLITGQNPSSARGMGEAVYKALVA